MVEPAAAFQIQMNDGSYWDIPNSFILVCAGFVVVVVAAGLSDWSESNSEVTAADLTQQYDDEAAQYRAMSRKLDAETDLAESVIKARRTRAELDDVEALFRDGKSRRRR
jgi:hypothetical protein